MTDSSGAAAKRFDYLPFGGDLLATIDGRTTGAGYYSSPSGVNPEFTGKNRDAETALDWFEIRHMSANQGRFQSPDPDNASASPVDPQTWNAYAYVGNNPLSYTDPSGESWYGWVIKIADALDKVFGGDVVGSGPSRSAGSSGGPWSEDIPYNLGSGSANIGGVFGGGSSGGGVFSYSDLTPLGLGGSANPILIALSRLPLGTAEKYRAPFVQGFIGAQKRLSQPDCSAFYGGQGAATMNLTTYRFLPLNGNAGAVTFDKSNVAINSTGAFISGKAKSGYLYRDWKADDLRSMILLHELGHQTKDATKFTNDTGIQQYNDMQSLKVVKACF